MKYIIDIDALKECLDLLPTSGVVDIKDVQKMIDAFPKDKLNDNDPPINTRSTLEHCMDCGNYGWDMPQCRECNAENSYKYFTRQYNDNE
jgi:hypothetical protein